MSESGIPESAPGPGRDEIRRLPAINNLLTASWRRYMASLNVFAIIYLLYFAPLAIVAAIMSSIYKLAPKPVNPLVLAWLAAGGVIIALISAWGQAAFIYAATGRFQETRKLLREALERTISFAWVFLIFGLSVLAGMVFFIIPGIIALVWFTFAVYVLAIEGDKGVGAVIKSRQYVRGRWWGVFFRLLPVWVLSFALNLLPGIGPLLAMLFMPFSITYQCVLFEELRAAKGPLQAPETAQKRKWAVVGGLVIVMAAFIVISAFSGIKSKQLKQMMQDPAGAIQNVIDGGKGQT